MPVKTIFVCGHCKVESGASAGPPIGWFQVSGPISPADTSPLGSEYFDKIDCLMAYLHEVTVPQTQERVAQGMSIVPEGAGYPSMTSP